MPTVVRKEAPSMYLPPWLSWLEGVAAVSVDARIALSVAIVVGSLVAIRFVVPWLVGIVHRTLVRTFVHGVVVDWRSRVAAMTPWWVSEPLAVSILQLAVAVVGAFALLVVWGQIQLALQFVSALSLSVPVVGQLGMTVGLLVLAWIGMDVVDSWLDRVTERSEQFSRHQEEIAFRTLQIVVLGAVGLTILHLWGVDLGGLLIGAGFLGIVVGMAARQTLGSLLAGFVLMFSRPFEIGDWVEIGQQEGIVTDITIVNTRLENFDGEFVVLPNDNVSNSTIINRSKKGRLRLRVEVGIDYDVDPDHAQTVAVDALTDLDDILTVPRPVAIARRLGDSSVVLELRFWIDKPSARRRAKGTSLAIQAVKEAFEREGIKIPFPQRELSDREESGGFRVVGRDAPADG